MTSEEQGPVTPELDSLRSENQQLKLKQSEKNVTTLETKLKEVQVTIDSVITGQIAPNELRPVEIPKIQSYIVPCNNDFTPKPPPQPASPQFVILRPPPPSLTKRSQSANECDINAQQFTITGDGDPSNTPSTSNAPNALNTPSIADVGVRKNRSFDSQRLAVNSNLAPINGHRPQTNNTANTTTTDTTPASIENLSNMHASLESELQNQKIESESLRSQLEAKNSDFTQVATTITNFESLIGKLAEKIEQLKANEQEANGLMEQVLTLGTQYSELKKQHNDLGTQHNALKTHHDELQTQNSEWETQNNQLKVQRDQLQTQYNQLNAQHSANPSLEANQRQELETQLATLHEFKPTSSDSLLSHATQTLAQLAQTLNATKTELSETKSELARFKQVHNNPTSNQQLQEWESKYNEEMKKSSDLQNQLAQLCDGIKKHNGSLKFVAGVADHLRQVAVSAAHTPPNLQPRATVADLQNELNREREKLQTVEKLLHDTQKKLDQAKTNELTQRRRPQAAEHSTTTQPLLHANRDTNSTQPQPQPLPQSLPQSLPQPQPQPTFAPIPTYRPRRARVSARFGAQAIFDTAHPSSTGLRWPFIRDLMWAFGFLLLGMFASAYLSSVILGTFRVVPR
eukprot:c12524_g1_i1.p1 GENE.c12524_g1_i1~~c12524_g1_i1.p1  ORF type:complete len:641 (+),score=191.81 c12524_g1_i1:34-1923(+)